MKFSVRELGWLKGGLGYLLDDYRERLSYTWRDEHRAEYERILKELDGIYEKLDLAEEEK